MNAHRQLDRPVIVTGLRTPFVARRSPFIHLSALELAKRSIAELIQRTAISDEHIDQVVFGQAVPAPSLATNLARDAVLGAGLRRGLDGYQVARGCATGYQAVHDVIRGIACGDITSAIAGGADSTSDAPVPIARPLAEALQDARAGAVTDLVAALKELKRADFFPVEPALGEVCCAPSMGEAAEAMAQENHISRAVQDDLAHRSHTLAHDAWERGLFDDEVMTLHLPPDFRTTLARDNLVQTDSERTRYADFAPLFDRRYGTVTAANSAQPADGASALLIMREDKARALGLHPLGYVRSSAFIALDPRRQMLLGPAYAIPRALDQAGIAWPELDLVDLHEAFAAQVLSVVRALESDRFAQEHLDRPARVGQVDWARFNIHGGSIAMGHPFAATGGRQILQALRALKRRGGQFALCATSAAGGLAAAMVLEATP